MRKECMREKKETVVVRHGQPEEKLIYSSFFSRLPSLSPHAIHHSCPSVDQNTISMLADDALYENDWEPENQPFSSMLRSTSSKSPLRRQNSVSSVASWRSLSQHWSRLSIQEPDFVKEAVSAVRKSIYEKSSLRQLHKRYSVDQKIDEVDRIEWLLRLWKSCP